MLATSSAPSASIASPSLSASFSCKASELLEALKGVDALRKSDPRGLLGASVFLSDSQCGLTVEAFSLFTSGALLAWLPSGKASGSFSLPLLPLLALVKTTKGKGTIAYREGKLSSSESGASLSLPFGGWWEDHPDQNEGSARGRGYSLPSIASMELPADSIGFALSPFLLVSRFCSADRDRQALIGSGFYGGNFYATDGHSLRKAPASLSALPKAQGGFPSDAWLPAWLSSIVEAFTKPAERENLLGFYFPTKGGSQSLRFGTKGGSIVALRFPASPGTFPQCDQLFPSSLPFAFEANTKTFLSTVENLLQGLKASDGSPFIELTFDGCILEVELSAKIQKNVGTKRKPELEDVGSQDAALRCLSIEAPTDPSLDDGFYDLPEAQQATARQKFMHESRVLINGFFLQKALKSFLQEGDNIRFQWKDCRSVLMLSAFTKESKAVIMPVLKRR